MPNYTLYTVIYLSGAKKQANDDILVYQLNFLGTRNTPNIHQAKAKFAGDEDTISPI